MKLDFTKVFFYRYLSPHRQQETGIVVCEDTDNGTKNPLSAKGEERVDQCSVVGVSNHRHALVFASPFTHPVVASLDHLLFAARKEGKEIFSIIN